MSSVPTQQVIGDGVLTLLAPVCHVSTLLAFACRKRTLLALACGVETSLAFPCRVKILCALADESKHWFLCSLLAGKGEQCFDTAGKWR